MFPDWLYSVLQCLMTIVKVGNVRLYLFMTWFIADIHYQMATDVMLFLELQYRPVESKTPGLQKGVYIGCRVAQIRGDEA